MWLKAFLALFYVVNFANRSMSCLVAHAREMRCLFSMTVNDWGQRYMTLGGNFSFAIVARCTVHDSTVVLNSITLKSFYAVIYKTEAKALFCIFLE